MKNKLYIFCGTPFSGKSILSKELAKQKGFTRIDLEPGAKQRIIRLIPFGRIKYLLVLTKTGFALAKTSQLTVFY